MVFVFRERATAHRTIRRNEKKIKEFQATVEDERKQGEIYKADVRQSRSSVDLLTFALLCLDRLRRLAARSGP